MNIIQKVEVLLKNTPHLRDSDDKLIATIWYEQAKRYSNRFNDEQLKAVYRFLLMLAEGELANFKTVIRERQKLQREDINMRGKNWARRQLHSKDWAHKYSSQKNRF